MPEEENREKYALKSIAVGHANKVNMRVLNFRSGVIDTSNDL
jgi:hypothetical protein